MYIYLIIYYFHTTAEGEDVPGYLGMCCSLLELKISHQHLSTIMTIQPYSPVVICDNYTAVVMLNARRIYAAIVLFYGSIQAYAEWSTT